MIILNSKKERVKNFMTMCVCVVEQYSDHKKKREKEMKNRPKIKFNVVFIQ
jgi:hypothetical protein